MKKADRCRRPLSSFCHRPTLHCTCMMVHKATLQRTQCVLPYLLQLLCKIKTEYTLLCKRAKQICFGCIQVTACLLLSPLLFFAFVFLYLHLHSSVAPSCTCAHSISLSDEMQNVSYAEVDLKNVFIHLCILHLYLYFYLFAFLFWVFLPTPRASSHPCRDQA